MNRLEQPTLVDPVLVSQGNNALLNIEREYGGVPRVFNIRGTQLVKCLICDASAEHPFVICGDCSRAVGIVREIGASTLERIGQLIATHGFMELLELVGQKGLKEWMVREMKELEEG